MPTTAALTFPAGRESIAGGLASTSVVSTSSAPRMAVDEATSGELLSEEQFRKEMHRRERKNARRAAAKQTAEWEASRLQLDQEETRAATMARSSSPYPMKTRDLERSTMLLQLRSSGALQYAHANPVEEARLAWDLAGNIMASREVGQREDHPNPDVPEERPSLSAREGPLEVEPARHARSCKAICKA